MTSEEIDYYVKSKTLSILFGNKMSQEELDNSILSDSQFLISQKQSNGTYVSKKISYSDIINQMSRDISALLHLSSMAFHDTWEYSKKNHTHDYNWVRCNPTYTINSPEFTDKSQIKCICSVLTSNSYEQGVVSILYPPYTKPTRKEADIGEMRLFMNKAMGSSSQILQTIDDGTFDGWVYANGDTYAQYQGLYNFTEAYNHFKGSGGRFTVPNINNFLNLDGNPSYINSYGITKAGYQNVLPIHSHVLDFSGKITNQLVSMTVKFPAGDGGSGKSVDYGNIKGLHVQYDSWSSYLIHISVDSMEIDNIKLFSECGYAGNDIETYPSHKVVPLMVYIGRGRNSN